MKTTYQQSTDPMGAIPLICNTSFRCLLPGHSSLTKCPFEKVDEAGLTG
jgi:hypothetical protein